MTLTADSTLPRRRLALPRRSPTGPRLGRARSVVAFFFPFAVLVAAWHTVVVVMDLRRNILPKPATVLSAFGDMIEDGSLVDALAVSSQRLVVGLAFGITTGILLGLLMGFSRPVGEFLEPLTNFFTALSGVAWVPIAIVWFGLGDGSLTFVLWNSVFWVVFYNVMSGTRAVPRIFISAHRTMGAPWWKTIMEVYIPGAMPNIALGVRLGISFGWRALIVAEMAGGSDGMGQLIFQASYYQQADRIFAGIATIGVIWLATDYIILRPFERRTVERWGIVQSVDSPGPQGGS